MVHEGRVVELIEPVNVVGADPECDVVLLPRRDIDSWHHATILVGDEIEVRDGVDGSKSTNGVFVNKRRINGSAVVHEGDMIHFATINGPGWLVNETNG